VKVLALHVVVLLQNALVVEVLENFTRIHAYKNVLATHTQDKIKYVLVYFVLEITEIK